MGRYCLVPKCVSQSGGTASDGSKIKVHAVPRNKEISKMWLNLSNREGPVNYTNSGICSLHFKESDYMRDLNFELTNPGQSQLKNQNRKLRDDAMPSLRIPGRSEDLPRAPGLLKQKQEREELLKDIPELAVSEAEHDEGRSPGPASPLPPPASSPPEHLVELEALKSKVAELTEALHAKAEEVKAAQAHPRTQLKSIFTDQQIDVILEGKRPCPWDDDTLARAVSLRARLSRSQYRYLRELGLPLPSLATLERRLQQFRVQRGDATTSIAILERSLRDRPAQDRAAVIMFDEMKVTSVADYDPTDDQILGPFEYLQQVMVRGLMADWQLPVFFDFNRAVDRTLLEELVTQLEEAGARVMAVVSDQGGPDHRVNCVMF